MPAYTVEFTTAAMRDLADLARDVQRRVDARIVALARDPRPAGVEKLAGSASLYRIRVGDYRIIYEIADRLLVVTITRVRHRRGVYRRPQAPGSWIRGGSWGDGSCASVLVANPNDPSVSISFIGFRCAR